MVSTNWLMGINHYLALRFLIALDGIDIPKIRKTLRSGAMHICLIDTDTQALDQLAQ
ncbi:MAG: hypothetical protein ACR2QW_17235 [bacterium]